MQQLARSWAQITLTQTPNEISATLGETVSLSCTSSSSVHTNYLHWYQQKSGQRPTLIIRSTNTLQSGVPARFSGSGSGTDYTLKISDIKDEDEADYYCHQGSWAQITLTQTPNEITTTPGQTVTISCRSSSYVSTDNLHWYQQKSGQCPTLIIRFSGSGSETDYTLKISDIKDEDEADYYCQQDYHTPLTQ
ncbi:hypothetical protein AB205_0085600 [Aquarana catesbeiana]|uniref:Ig-like domain-containing protein n=1 Tax=Aquarana catesbeiana TaxID=8400 RepID=A0A2G9RBL1_AQUCT|nr:hypothetical protein AB205_0085600 [Aquarana catesbeiana]